jgi:membrane protease YdiL (CAAX protease family)
MQSSKFATRRPYLFAALLLVAVIVIYLAAGTAAALLELPALSVHLIANAALALLAAGLLTRLRFWKEVGFRPLVTPRDLLLYWLPFTVVLVNLAFGIARLGWGEVAFYFVLAALIGFSEEAIFRGLILRAIAPHGFWKAAVVSSLLFGLAHSLNLLGGANPLYTLLQVGYTLAIGFGFAAVALRTRVLWPLVIIHALIDFASFLASHGVISAGVTSLDLVISAIFTVAFIAYGLSMLAGSRRSQLQAEAALAAAHA